MTSLTVFDVGYVILVASITGCLVNFGIIMGSCLYRAFTGKSILPPL